MPEFHLRNRPKLSGEGYQAQQESPVWGMAASTVCAASSASRIRLCPPQHDLRGGSSYQQRRRPSGKGAPAPRLAHASGRMEDLP